jgi:hypothetical protein
MAKFPYLELLFWGNRGRTMSETAKIKLPFWFWIIAVISLLWNGIGLMDYYNSVSLNEAYLAQNPGWLEFIKQMPMWAKAGWGTATTLSVLGSAALLLRKSWAFHLFALSIVGMFVSFGYQMTSPLTPEMPVWMNLFTALIFVIAFFLLWFAGKSRSKGWIS